MQLKIMILSIYFKKLLEMINNNGSVVASFVPNWRHTLKKLREKSNNRSIYQKPFPVGRT